MTKVYEIYSRGNVLIPDFLTEPFYRLRSTINIVINAAQILAHIIQSEGKDFCEMIFFIFS